MGLYSQNSTGQYSKTGTGQYSQNCTGQGQYSQNVTKQYLQNATGHHSQTVGGSTHKMVRVSSHRMVQGIQTFFKVMYTVLTVQYLLFYRRYFVRQIQFLSEQMLRSAYSTVQALGMVLAGTSPAACTERLVCQLVQPFADKLGQELLSGCIG